MSKAEAWKPEVRVEDFSQVVSRTLVAIEPNEEQRTFLLAQIIEAQSSDRSASIAEAGVLVETLDKVRITHENPPACSQVLNLQLVQKVNDRAVRDSCVRILSKVCRDNVLLPESYIIPDVSVEEKWRTGGVADVWAGKLGQGDGVYIKVFRRHPSPWQQEKIKGVS